MWDVHARKNDARGLGVRSHLSSDLDHVCLHRRDYLGSGLSQSPGAVPPRREMMRTWFTDNQRPPVWVPCVEQPLW